MKTLIFPAPIKEFLDFFRDNLIIREQLHKEIVVSIMNTTEVLDEFLYTNSN